MQVEGKRIDPKFMCPTFIEGYQQLGVGFSYHRAIERQKDGTWKAAAPRWGLEVVADHPLHAEWGLTAKVRQRAVEMLEAGPTTP